MAKFLSRHLESGVDDRGGAVGQLQRSERRKASVDASSMGSFEMNLKIAASGDVEKAVVKSSTTGYQEFDEDIAKKVNNSWKFPKSKTGGNVTVPFTFREDR